MADANEATTRADHGGTVKAGSVSIPTLVLNASATALVGFALSIGAVMLDASLEFIVITAVLAVVGGCGILAALVAHNCRKTADETRVAIIDAMKTYTADAEADLCDIRAAVAKVTEIGVKNHKAVSRIANGLMDCKTLISAEVDTVNTELAKLRAAQYTLFADNKDTGTAGRPNLGVVKN